MPVLRETETLPSRTARRVRRVLTDTWQVFLVGAVVLAVGVLAVLSPGLVRADVRLDEGTVHVVNQEAGGLGVLNAQIDELADYATVGDSRFELLQDEDRVLVHGTESSTLVNYDPGLNRLDSPVQLPAGAKVTLAGGTLLVVDPSNGKAWFGNPEELLEVDFQERRATMELGDFGDATLTFDGDVIGLDIQRSLLLRQEGESVAETPLPFTLDGVGEFARLSSVGTDAVVLDTASGRIWVEGMAKAFEVSGAQGAQLVPHARDALAGGRNARAIYATRAGLMALTPDGPRSLEGTLDAAPSVPIQVGECVHAAFGDQFVKACRGLEPIQKDIPGPGVTSDPSENPPLVFQTNRSTVVLNDVINGVLWRVGENDMIRIDNWAGVIPPELTSGTTAPTLATVIPPDREKNRAPIAKDDELAARAGRSTILDVLDNDADPDGDILTISANSEVSGATFETVRDGSGLQMSVDANTSGVVDFTYTVSDGRAGTDVARVSVRVLPADPGASNEAPRARERAAPLEIGLGDTVTTRVLLDWRDPDGDSLVLLRAWLPPASADEISFTPEGDITFRDIGTTTGRKTVNIEVSDGHDVVGGEMLLEVSDQAVPPIAHGDFVSVGVGRTVVVHPLANDIGDRLALTQVEKDPGCNCTVAPNYREQRFSFSAAEPGVHYVTYKVSSGPVAMGLVRIDVLPQASESPPVAALDVALLPPGGSVTIDPLLNDTDLDGDVLVVQSVSSAPGLQVAMARRHLVTVTAPHAPQGPVTLTYRLSDGQFSVFGTIVVIPTTSTGSFEPQALDDEVRIRAGATQSIDVLRNDTSPMGLEMELEELVDNPLGSWAWIDHDRLRVSVPAGTQASSITLIYQLRDSDGRVASAKVRITVVSDDAQNVAPVPPPVEERALANTVTKLIVDTDGIDPNGDSVRLVGLGSGPSLGRVMAVGDGWLTYEAFEGSEGTDVFSYRVIDSLGAVGEGEIRVGVAPAGPENSPPVGVRDEIRVRPGSPVQVAALRNDVDVDGDGIRYVAGDPAGGAPVEIDDVDEVALIENRDLSFTAPMESGIHVGTYGIEDLRGAQGSGEVHVRVAENAPLLPPEPRDDVVPVSALEGPDWVEVDVTANDLDPDGRIADLRVEIPDYGAAEGHGAHANGPFVSVEVKERMQEIRYEVVDTDGLRATGLLLVPGRNNMIPTLRDPLMNLTAVAGQVTSLRIGELVRGTAGHAVRLTSVDKVAATHGRVLPDAMRIDYTPDIDHVGPASVVFEVSDVVSDSGAEAASAFISIPITVVAPPNRLENEDDEDTKKTTAYADPELIGGLTPILRVGPGEGDARLDLSPLFRDADGDDFFFEVPPAVKGNTSITWRTSSDSTMLLAHTAADTAVGTTVVLNAVVVDTREGRTPFQIRIEVISSTRPLATTVTDVVEARAGKETPVAVLSNDRSNLLDDTSLTLLEASVINGSGGIAVVADEVIITPTAGFVGTMTARYTIVDGTGDPDRRVDGTIQLTVKDRPSRPGAPREASIGNGTVSFIYTPGSANGFEITSRVATAIDSSGSVAGEAPCSSTTCTVTNLPNGQPYRFQVVETNEAGASDPSPLSAPWTPDVKPSAPATPTVMFGDGSLSISWRAPVWQDPSKPGSPVDRYTVALLDGAGNSVGIRENLGAGSTSLMWDGLRNGTRYRARVLAGNGAGESPYSEMSAVEWPAGPPLASAGVSATATQNPLGGAFEVAWAAAGTNDNGDPITAFIVTPVTKQGIQAALARTVAASGQATQSVLIEGLGQQPHKFRVEAVNKAGPGATAVTAGWQTAWELPTIDSFSAVAGDGEIQMELSTNFEGRAAADPQLQYRLDGGDWRPYPADGRATGLTNGQVLQVAVRLVVDGDRASAASEVLSRMPRSATPTWGTIDESGLAFRGFVDEVPQVYVPLRKPATLLASGGWEPSGYWSSCGGEVSCAPQERTASDGFLVSSGALLNDSGTAAITLGHFESDQTSEASVTLNAPFTGSWDAAAGKLDVQLNYVRDASCRVTGGGVDGADVIMEERQGGGTSLNIDTVVPAAADGATLPSRVDVTCTFGTNSSASLVLGG